MERNYQKFFTPAYLADRLVELANIESGNVILEPHVGDGAIIEAVLRKFPNSLSKPNTLVYFCEKNINLSRNVIDTYSDNACCVGEDFLQMPTYDMYERIIANPPFNKDEDVGLHLIKMIYSLRHGGRLVTILPKHFGKYTSQKMLTDVFNCQKDVRYYELDNWATNSDGTTTPLRIYVIDKSNGTYVTSDSY